MPLNGAGETETSAEGARGPSLTKLIKLLKLSTSSNDHEALLAIRAANRELLKFPGADWGSLLNGKVTVIGDPFAGLDAPATAQRHRPSPPRAPTQPPPPKPSPPPPPRVNRNWFPNKHPGKCLNCGFKVAANGGEARRNYNDTGWEVRHVGTCPSYNKRGTKLDLDKLGDIL